MTRVYFAGAIKGDTTHAASHSTIIDMLRAMGDDLVVYHEQSPDIIPLNALGKNKEDVFQRDLQWLQSSDALVAEVSGESFGVGWEIAYAQRVLHMPVLCLVSRKVRVPEFLLARRTSNLHWATYRSKADLKRILYLFLDFVKSNGERQFTAEAEPSQPGRQMAQVIEGEVWRKDSSAYLIALDQADQKRDPLVSALRALASRLDVGELKQHPEALRDLLRKLERPPGQGLPRAAANPMIYIADASKPSLQVGWLACFAQEESAYVILTAETGKDLSWMITGQPRELDFERPDDQRRRARPGVRVVTYSSAPELLASLKSAVNEILAELATKPRSRQRMLLSPGRQWRGLTVTHEEFLAECLLHDALWQSVTAGGIEGTFVSGERATLLRFLIFGHLLPRPADLYALVRNMVRYEEKAFAKNIRAMRDAAILLSTGKRQPHEARHTRLNLDRRRIATTGGKASKSFLSDSRLVLTDFGWDLTHLIDEHPDIAETINQFLRENRIKVDIDAEALSRLAHGEHRYLLAKVDGDLRRKVLDLAFAPAFDLVRLDHS